MTSLSILKKGFRVYERGKVKPLFPGYILCIDEEDPKIWNSLKVGGVLLSTLTSCFEQLVPRSVL